MIRVLVAAAVATLALPVSAEAEEYVSGSRLLNVATQGPVGQSFVASDRLNSFGFQFASLSTSSTQASVTFTLRAGSGTTGAVVATRTASITAGANRAISWYDFNLTGLTGSVTAGQTYTALVSTGTANFGLAYGPDLNGDGTPVSPPAYDQGTLVAGRSIAGCGTANAGCDANFRFNDATGAAPEPGTWAFMILGFGVVGSTLRRSRRIQVSSRVALATA